MHGDLDLRSSNLGAPAPDAFFRRPVLEVARDILGLVLVSRIGGRKTAGRIVEVEAYRGPKDLAAHSARGRRTPRNEVLYGRGGRTYVYLIYGLHHCMNVVVGDEDVPEAILLRGLEPVLGLPTMRDRRGGRPTDAHLARGPGNLTRALGIERSHNDTDLRHGRVQLLVPPAGRFSAVTARDIVRSPRIGIDYAGTWAAKPWRFSVRDHPSVSHPPPSRGGARSVGISASAPSSRSARRALRPDRSSPR